MGDGIIKKYEGGCCDGFECLIDYNPFNNFGVTKRCKKGEYKILKTQSKYQMKLNIVK